MNTNMYVGFLKNHEITEKKIRQVSFFVKYILLNRIAASEPTHAQKTGIV